jgi:hypothetical protein
MELEALMEETVLKLQDDFYSKKFYFSYSSLNKLLWNPIVFHQMYVLGNREEKTESYLVQGKIIHALLLEEHNFGDQFIVSPGKLPGDGIKAVVDSVFNHYTELSKDGDTRTELAEFGNAIIDVMRDANYYQNLKTDQQRLDKIITTEALNYWDFLKTKGNKILIDQETYDFCKNAVDIIKLNPAIIKLLALDTNEFHSREIFNEFPLQGELSNYMFGLKGIVDNLVIDHDTKSITINDIKTSSKELKDFPESIEFYNYWLQAIIYISLISIKYENLVNQGYSVNFNFITIDKNFQVYPFAVSEKTKTSWLLKFFDVLEKANWHYVNKNYELPYEFANNMVVL